MKNQEKTQIKTAESLDIAHSVDESRRSFSKKGLIAPVIMTLANRSAWGANVCVGTGFQSFSKAGGVLPSHAVADKQDAGTANWKSPNTWLQSYTTWRLDTSKFLPVRSGEASPQNKPLQKYQIYTGSSWTNKNGNNKYTLDEINTYLTTNNLVGIVGQLTGFSGNTNTLYDALLAGATSGVITTPSLEIYQIATAMNQLIHPLAIPPIGAAGGAFTEQDYFYFYRDCVNS